MESGMNQPAPASGRLSKDASLTLVLQGLFTFAYALSNTFLNLYLWRLTESLWVNGTYNLIVFMTTAAGFIVSGRMTKRLGKMLVFRVGIGLFAVFYLLVITLQSQVAAYYPLFALFLGVATGIYWIGYWTLTYEASGDGNRLRFIGLSSVVSTLSNLTAPLVSAGIFLLLPGNAGYIVIFALAFLLYFVTGLLSRRIPNAVPARKTYYLRHMAIIFRRDPNYRKAIFANLLFGVRQGVQLLLPVLLLYQAFKDEDRIGLLNAMLSFFSIAASYLFSHFAKDARIRVYLVRGAALMTIGACLLLGGLSPWRAVGFMIACSIGNPIMQTSLDGYNYRLIGKLPLRGEMRVEGLVLREVCWNIGRAISMMLLLLASGSVTGMRMAVIVVCIMASQLALAAFVEKPERSVSPRTTELLPHRSLHDKSMQIQLLPNTCSEWERKP